MGCAPGRAWRAPYLRVVWRTPRAIGSSSARNFRSGSARMTRAAAQQAGHEVGNAALASDRGSWTAQGPRRTRLAKRSEPLGWLQRDRGRRLIWPAVLALALCACQPARESPVLEGVVPASLQAAELPSIVRLRGSGLAPALAIDLDDRSPAQVLPPEVRVGGTVLPNARWVSPAAVEVTVPRGFAPGVHSVALQLGHNRSATLAEGLSIVLDPASPVAAGTKPDAGVGVQDAPDTSAAADAGSAEQEAPDAGQQTVKQKTPDAALPPGPSTTPDAGSRFEADAGAGGGGDGGAAAQPAPLSGPDLETCLGSVAQAAPVTIEGLGGESAYSPSLSADSRRLYYSRSANLLSTGEQIWMAERPDRGLVFSGSVNLGTLTGGSRSGTPFISRDELSLYFYSESSMGSGGGRDLYVATRTDTSAPFDQVRELSELNSADSDHLPWVSPDELHLLFLRSRGLTSDLWEARRATKAEAFGAPVALASVDTGGGEGRAFASDDGNALLWSAESGQSLAGAWRGLWLASRSSPDAPFTNRRSVADSTYAGSELDVTLSVDGAELFFVTITAQGAGILRALTACPLPP